MASVFGKDQHARREIRQIQMSSGWRARDKGERKGESVQGWEIMRREPVDAGIKMKSSEERAKHR